MTGGSSEEQEVPVLSLAGAIACLAAITAFVGANTEFLAWAIVAVSVRFDINQVFLGIFVLPIAGNLAEHAVIVAATNEMELSIAVALGSSTQVAIFIESVTLLAGWAMVREFTLDFDVLTVLMPMVAIIVAYFVCNDDVSNWLLEMQLVATYCLIGFVFRLEKEGSPSGSRGAFGSSMRRPVNALSCSYLVLHCYFTHLLGQPHCYSDFVEQRAEMPDAQLAGPLTSLPGWWHRVVAGTAGAASGDASRGGNGFLQSPGIAQRELLRQFYQASSSQEQMRLLEQATGQPLDLSTRCGGLLHGTPASNIVPLTSSSLQMLCHSADLSLEGMLPGGVAQQAELMRALHAPLKMALPRLTPLHLATMLWSYAAVGAAGDWIDALLQQVAEQELAAGRLARYSTKELASILYAYGRLLRQYSPEVRQYGAALAGELGRRWGALPYVKSSFTSTDFADLAEACATLYGTDSGASRSGGTAALRSSGGVSISSESSACRTSSDGSTASSNGASGRVACSQQPPPAVVTLLEEVAGEVRRQLAGKHSLRSTWTPRDLVRLVRSYAALGHHTLRAAQMLDVLSSFCVQRIRSRHLNCVSRPADLLGLLEAYADLQHATVAVPELLAAVADQVRRGAAQQQEQQDVIAAEATEQSAGTREGGGGPPATAAGTPAAAAAAAAGGMPPHAQQMQAQQVQAGPREGFTLAGINSLLDSYLRLGYRPPPLLLQCLVPQVRRQLPGSPAVDAAVLLQLLAAVQLNPGTTMVGLLLGRVIDETGSGGGGSCEMALVAQQAADALLSDGSGSAT